MSANKNLLALVLFLVGVAGGMLLQEHSNPDGLYALTVQEMGTDKLNQLCQNSAAIQGIANTDPAHQRDFQVTAITTTPIADRGVLCQVKGTLTNHLSGGRYSTATIERLVFLSARTGDAEEVSPETFKYLQSSVVIKSLASNKPKKELAQK